MRSRNLQQYVLLHQSRVYGNTGAKMRRFLNPWIRRSRARSVLDYGAGRGGLVFQVDAPEAAIRHQYDPAIPELDSIPLSSYDLVLCTDVLEHLDEKEVPGVLSEIRSLTGKAILIIGTAPARASLPSGENAHATVRPASWWVQEVRKQFPDAQRIPVFRRNRVGIKTWRSPPLQWMGASADLLRTAFLRKLGKEPVPPETERDQS